MIQISLETWQNLSLFFDGLILSEELSLCVDGR